MKKFISFLLVFWSVVAVAQYDPMTDPFSPLNPTSPTNPSNPANPASPLNPINQHYLFDGTTSGPASREEQVLVMWMLIVIAVLLTLFTIWFTWHVLPDIVGSGCIMAIIGIGCWLILVGLSIGFIYGAYTLWGILYPT